MADKGFPKIETGLLERGCDMVMPPFRIGQKQFTTQENKETYDIASVRIHIERQIACMKRFSVLRHLDYALLPKIDKILVTIAHTVNFFPPLIKDE